MLPTNITEFLRMFSGSRLAAYIFVAICNAALLFFASLKFVLVMQQCGYKGKKYFKWLSARETPYLSRLMLLCLLGFLFFCVLSICFSPVFSAFMGENGSRVSSVFGFVSYGLFTLIYIRSESAVNAKVPLKKTKRLVRLCVTFIILLAIFTFALITLFNFIAYLIGSRVVWILRLSLICGTPLLSPYILFLAYAVNEPIETVVRRRYIKRTTEVLSRADVIKIGITGSYGKTSVKEILRTILSQKYRVLSTPSSYNTPAGIALTVRRKLDNTCDVFIAEMGARSKGDIKLLANIVKPNYGVLTGVNNQHLETFGNIENTKDTKFELFENLSADGRGFFSVDSENAAELYQRFDGEKYSTDIDNPDCFVYASDIVMDENGTTFTLNVKGEQPVSCNTVLLGKHNIRNVCLAAAVAYKIGLTVTEISQGVNRLQSVGHRLELVPNNKNIVIIDDSYNSNEAGTRAAMDVIDIFKGRKIVVTPGLVELGKEENVANTKFGKLLSEHADKVIIVGKHNAEMLINGLLDGGMKKEDIIFAKNLKKGNEELNSILKEGDVVLFENDLPDNYN